jgi:hypothetical protein
MMLWQMRLDSVRGSWDASQATRVGHELIVNRSDSATVCTETPSDRRSDSGSVIPSLGRASDTDRCRLIVDLGP